MIYFIPAWYKENTWSENAQVWYVRRMHTEFDDTVKQIQLFHRSHEYEYKIMLLSHSPNLRHFLHRQSVYRAPYWSCFDAIQEVTRKKIKLISFRDLRWPDNVVFNYTSFVIDAMRDGKKYAQIDFGEDGNMVRVNIYRDNVLVRSNIYDDRGFISCTKIYENGEEAYRDYLMDNGMWKMHVFNYDGHVEINPLVPHYTLEIGDDKKVIDFKHLKYHSIDDVIEEVLASYISFTTSDDIFCAAMHERHADLLNKLLADKKRISSIYENRYDITDAKKRIAMLTTSQYIVTDIKDSVDYLKEKSLKADETVKNHQCLYGRNIVNISPFDTRKDFGISQQIPVKNILLTVDNLNDDIFSQAIDTLAKLLDRNPKTMVHLFTRKSDYNMREVLLKKVQGLLEQTGHDPMLAMPEDINQDVFRDETLVDMEEAKKTECRFFVDQCVDELEVSKCIREQRILVDLRNTPELYMQISAISCGIPQIVRQKNQYIEHMKNGIVLQKMSQLDEALEFYLAGLNNWNEAMINAYELGKQYTTKVLLEKWREVIRNLE